MKTIFRVIILICILEIILSNSCTSEEAGLVGEWHFDENDGITADDSSGNGNDGDINGAAWVGGVSGSALSFNGDDYVLVPGNPVSGEDGMSFEAWVYFDVVDVPSSGENVIFGHWTSDHNNFILFIDGDATTSDGLRLLVRDDSGSNKQFVWDTVPSASTWYHVSFTYKRNDYLRLYIDGVEVENTRTNDQPLKVDASDIYIGRSGHIGHDKFDGIIDEVRVYNQELSCDEICTAYNAHAAVPKDCYSVCTP